MASPRALALKTAGAVSRLEKASAALADKFGVEYSPMPFVKGNPDFIRAAHLEHIGNFLQNLAVSSKAAKAKDFEDEAPDSVVEEVSEPVEEVTEVEPKAKPKKKK